MASWSQKLRQQSHGFHICCVVIIPVMVLPQVESLWAMGAWYDQLQVTLIGLVRTTGGQSAAPQKPQLPCAFPLCA